MSRLFIAVPVARTVRARLAEVSRSVDTRNLRWVKPEAMHMTLAFLGEIDEADVAAVERAMREAAQAAPSVLVLRADGLGVFPDERRTRVLWAGVAGDVDALEALERTLVARLHEAGLLRERQRFHPHITLARLREPGRLPAGLPVQAVFGEWRATEIQLIESRLGSRDRLRRSAARYVVRGTARLDVVWKAEADAGSC